VLLGWGVVVLTSIALFALQGFLAAPGRLGEWTPDLGVVLLISWGARMAPGRAEVSALIVAWARSAFSADPFPVLAAGYLGVALLAGLLRRGIEVDLALPRFLLAGACAWGLSQLAIGARSHVLAGGPGFSSVPVGVLRLWPGALVTACGALLLRPLLVRLPALRALRRRYT